MRVNLQVETMSLEREKANQYKTKTTSFHTEIFFTVEGSFQIYLPNIGASKLKGSEVFLARDHLCP